MEVPNSVVNGKKKLKKQSLPPPPHTHTFFFQEEPAFSSLNKLNNQKQNFHAVHVTRNCF